MKQIIISSKTQDEAQEILDKFKGKTYKDFTSDKDAAYKFTSLMGTKVCPYCNINYSYTVTLHNGNPCIRPDIDHFIPKSKCIAKQLELTNLVPSCQVCNERLKRDKLFTRKTHIHPYFDDFDAILRFSVVIKGANYLDENDLRIVFKKRENANAKDEKRARNNVTDFALEERYQMHRDKAVDVFKRIQFYGKCKRIEIAGILGVSLSLGHILFPELDCNINETSLGKLGKDLVEAYL